MGISLDAFRLRIGLYNGSALMRGPASSSSDAPLIGKFGLSLRHIPVATLLLLSVTNPGPDFVCKYCKKCFPKSSLYVDHIKVHPQRKQFTIPCCFCQLNLKNVKSFNKHLSRFHCQVQVNPAVAVAGAKCPITSCAEDLESRQKYIEHVSSHLVNGESFQCQLGTCKSFFNDKRKHQKHMWRDHPVATFCETGNVFEASTSEGDFLSINYQDEFEADLVDEAEQDSSNVQTGVNDIYPESMVKEEVARFYLKLEGENLLATSAVQYISSEIQRMTEISHCFLKNALKLQLLNHGMSELVLQSILNESFTSDPIFNVHHRHEDVENLATNYMRNKFWKSRFPYVEPQEKFFGYNVAGKKRMAHYISIRETLQIFLRDEKIRDMVLKSFRECEDSAPSVLTDFTDGTAYAEHRKQHSDGKCIQILLFQDAFDFAAFGPASGVHKPIGFYYSLGNLPPEYRSKLELIQLAYIILEKDTTPTVQEEIDGVDVLKNALEPLLQELEDLKVNGIDVNGQNIPVCLMHIIGHSLGQHSIGGFVKSFSSGNFCRFCPISMEHFKEVPYDLPPLRKPGDYDEAVKKANALYNEKKKAALAVAKRRAARKAKQQAKKVASRMAAPASKTLIKAMISKSALLKVRAVNFKGVKYHPSPFNSDILKFHVASPSLAPCLAHDLFEGIFKTVIPKVMQYFISKKGYFDMKVLNRRIIQFKCKGTDADDPPKPFKSMDKLNGNAVQNWNLVRLLPLMIGDLIIDKNDPVWQLFLLLKEITEYVCAPKITMNQVAYLETIIRNYLSNLQNLSDCLPQCFISKQHFLRHFPTLISRFGPLIRLFTLRFESKHVFFKRVARACRSFVNITYTLARKYMCKFAYDHASGLLPPDVVHDPAHANSVPFLEEEIEHLPEKFSSINILSLKSISVKGILYRINEYLLLDSLDSTSLVVGRIAFILLNNANNVAFVLEETVARNSYQGYYELEKMSKKSYCYLSHEDLPDFYSLPAYKFSDVSCLTLKHSAVFM